MDLQYDPHRSQEPAPDGQYRQRGPENTFIPGIYTIASRYGSQQGEHDADNAQVSQPWSDLIQPHVNHRNQDQCGHHGNRQSTENGNCERRPDFEITTEFQRERKNTQKRCGRRHQYGSHTGPCRRQNCAFPAKSESGPEHADRIYQDNPVIHGNTQKDNKAQQRHGPFLLAQARARHHQRPTRADGRRRQRT